MEAVIVVAVFSGIIIPLGSVAYFVIKSYIAKAKYHVTMEAKIEYLSKHDRKSNDVHDGHDGRLSELEEKVNKLCDNVDETKGWIRLILDHLKIPYPRKTKSSI